MAQAFEASDMYCMNDFRRAFEPHCKVMIMESKNFADFIQNESIPKITKVSLYHYFKFQKTTAASVVFLVFDIILKRQVSAGRKVNITGSSMKFSLEIAVDLYAAGML